MKRDFSEKRKIGKVYSLGGLEVLPQRGGAKPFSGGGGATQGRGRGGGQHRGWGGGGATQGRGGGHRGGGGGFGPSSIYVKRGPEMMKYVENGLITCTKTSCFFLYRYISQSSKEFLEQNTDKNTIQ